VSKRENDVLHAIVDNLSNKEIAARLNISERTVKFHVSNLLAKFHVGRRSNLIRLFPGRSSRTEAVRALRAGRSDPGSSLACIPTSCDVQDSRPVPGCSAQELPAEGLRFP
jgi:DNA-binding CsgD family transcriptional regulator